MNILYLSFEKCQSRQSMRSGGFKAGLRRDSVIGQTRLCSNRYRLPRAGSKQFVPLFARDEFERGCLIRSLTVQL